ncbi:MAG: 2-aminoethylphosphonate aminotransferase [Catonella sp.]|nr:2-aminoethylphosphonate aminotransferase [Catonella sp.]
MREDLVKIVHGDPKEYIAVLFCGSGTICIDITLNSLLEEGKKALVVTNGSYSQRACDVLSYYGMPYISVKSPVDEKLDVSIVEKALQENPDVGYVYMTHHETGTGLLNPIREVGALAHKYGAFFITDTTSSYAMIPIDVNKDNIDFCMASAQKGIQAMSGLSYVIGKRSIIEKSADFPKRSYYCNLFRQYDYFEKTGEMNFTPPVQTIYAARQGLIEYWNEGEEAKWDRHQRVINAIREGVDRLGFKETLPREIQSGLVSAINYPNDPNWNFEKVHDYCYERGFTIYPGKMQNRGTFRLCALGAIDAPDIEAFWKVFEEALHEYNIAVPVKY